MSSHNIIYWKYLKLLCGFYDVDFKLWKPLNILWGRKNVNIDNISMLVNNIHINNQYENSFNYNSKSKKDIIILIFNILYFLLILTFFLTQPVSLLITCITNKQFIKQYIGFISLFLLPTVNYVWLKYYMTSNHINVIFDSYKNRYIKHKNIFIVSITFSLLYVVFIISFYKNIRNKSYFLNESKYGFWIYFVVNEIITKTIIFHNYIISILTFYKHNRELNSYIYEIENKSNFVLETNTYINTLIKEVSILKIKVEMSIYYFNNLISVSTVLVCLSMFLFFDAIFRQYQKLVNYVDAFVYTIFYLLVQCIFFIIIYKYAEQRNNLYNAVAKHSFLYRFIYTKTINMQDETNKISAILNWMTLKEILSNDWIDFRIMGISSKDGDLVKKSIALASILIIIFSV